MFIKGNTIRFYVVSVMFLCVMCVRHLNPSQLRTYIQTYGIGLTLLTFACLLTSHADTLSGCLGHAN